MKGVILAAGKGTRLYPVTKAIAKPLLPMANRMTMEYAFDQMKECGITELCIVVGENEAEMKTTLGDGSQFGLNLTFVKQSEPLGLAHAVGFAKDFVGSDDFMLYLGDAIYGESLKPFVEKFKAEGAANLNLVKWVEDPRRFGVANIKDGRIVKLVEKPEVPESNMAMAGMYIFGPQLWDVLVDLKPSARGEYEITDAIQMLVDRGHLVIPGEYEGEWFDTGTLPSFLETTKFLTKGKSLVDPTAKVNAEFRGMVVIGANAIVDVLMVEDSVILPDSVVSSDGTIKRCLVGGNSIFSDDVEDKIFWDGKS